MSGRSGNGLSQRWERALKSYGRDRYACLSRDFDLGSSGPAEREEVAHTRSGIPRDDSYRHSRLAVVQSQ